MKRQALAERTAAHHAEALARRQSVNDRKAASTRSTAVGEEVSDDDPLYDKEKSIVERIMMRSSADLNSRYPIIGQPIPSVASLKHDELTAINLHGKRRLSLARGNGGGGSGGALARTRQSQDQPEEEDVEDAASTNHELTQTVCEGLRRVGSMSTQQNLSFANISPDGLMPNVSFVSHSLSGDFPPPGEGGLGTSPVS